MNPRAPKLGAEDAERVFTEAMMYFERGAFDEAAQLCRQLQTSFPRNASVLQLFGLVQLKRGLADDARAKLDRAVELAPEDPELMANYGAVLADTGRPGLAAEMFQRARALAPREPRIVANLLIALRNAGKLDEAATTAAEATGLFPRDAALLNQHAEIEEIRGRTDLVLIAARRLAALAPHDVRAQARLGWIALRAGALELALAAFARWVEIAPGDAKASDALGLALQASGRFEEAIAAHFRALEQAPRDGGVLCNLGSALVLAGKHAEAEAVLRRAEANPETAIDARVSLATLAARRSGDDAAALAAFEAVLRDAPLHRGARLGAALALLARGDLPRGFEMLEARFEPDAFGRQAVLREFKQPRWRGEKLGGAALLLQPEQEIGDTIQFLRFASLLAERGEKIVLGVQAELTRVASWLHGAGITIVPPSVAVPDFAARAPLMSLPAVLHTRLDELRAMVPYLTVPPEIAAQSRARMDAGSALRVGLVWSADQPGRAGSRRALDFADLAPVLAVPGVFFVLLQPPPAAVAQDNVLDLSPALLDLADTAAAIAALDLLIAVESTALHLAGAMGHLAWGVLAPDADWRWMAPRVDTAWYPSLQLFRAPRDGATAASIPRIAELLHRLVPAAEIGTASDA